MSLALHLTLHTCRACHAEGAKDKEKDKGKKGKKGHSGEGKGGGRGDGPEEERKGDTLLLESDAKEALFVHPIFSKFA